MHLQVITVLLCYLSLCFFFVFADLRVLSNLIFFIYGVKIAARVSNTAVHVAKCLCVYIKANTSCSDLDSVAVRLRLHGHWW